MAESNAHSLLDSESKTCESLVKGHITNILKTETKNMVFERIHRLGKPTRTDKPRPIIARFHYYGDRERVRNEAFARKENLKQHNLSVGVQMPKEWRDARQDLYPTLREEKRKGNNVKFVGDKLFINGKRFTPNNTH